MVAEWSIASRAASLSATEAGAEAAVVVVTGVDVPGSPLVAGSMNVRAQN